jgi:hypothetical protein
MLKTRLSFVLGFSPAMNKGFAQGQENPGTPCTETQKQRQTEDYINYCAGYSDGSGRTNNSAGNELARIGWIYVPKFHLH